MNLSSFDSNSSEVTAGQIIFLETSIVLVMMFGIPGNMIVILIVASFRQIRSPGTILIANLSLSDMLYLSIILPIRFIAFHNQDWLWGDTLCKLSAGLAYCFYGATASSMSAIALNRYLHVVKPRYYKVVFGKRGLILHIVIIWLGVSTLTLIFPLSGFWGDYAFRRDIYSCTFSDNSPASYQYVVMTFGITVPCFFIIFCYTLIYYNVKKSQTRIQSWLNKKSTLVNKTNVPSSMKKRTSNDVTASSVGANETTSVIEVLQPQKNQKRNENHKINLQTNRNTSLTYHEESNQRTPYSQSECQISTLPGEPSSVCILKERNDVCPINDDRNEQNKTQSNKPRMKRVHINLSKNAVIRYNKNSSIARSGCGNHKDALKMTVMMAFSFTIYLACVFPHALVNFIKPSKDIPLAYLLSLVFSWLNGCINPILYALMNAQYRQACKALFCRNICHCKENRDVEISMSTSYQNRPETMN